MPEAVECEDIPDKKDEIPSPEKVSEYPHLEDIACHLHPLKDDANIMLLIGKDAGELLKVRESRNGPRGAPCAQKTDLGWTVLGKFGVNRHHPSNEMNAFQVKPAMPGEKHGEEQFECPKKLYDVTLSEYPKPHGPEPAGQQPPPGGGSRVPGLQARDDTFDSRRKWNTVKEPMDWTEMKSELNKKSVEQNQRTLALKWFLFGANERAMSMNSRDLG